MNRRVWIAACLAIVLCVVGGIFYAHTRSANSVTLLSTDQRGDNPFGPSLVVDGGSTPTAQLDRAARQAPDGDQDGLYFDTTGAANCHRQTLAALLSSDPKLAETWSGAIGGTGADAPAYLATLTPVRLRADAQVTAFSYTTGEAAPYQAILQAGSAVLVDNHGLPRVDCANSNPLAAPAPIAEPHYDGTTWTGFNPTDVIEIHPADALVREFGLVNPAGAAPFRRPQGTDGTQDIAQLPTTGRLDGHYTFTGPMTQCENLLTCQQDTGLTFSMDTTFTGCPNTCTMMHTGIRAPGGGTRDAFTQNFPLSRVADTWQESGTETRECLTRSSHIVKGQMNGTWHLTIAVINSEVADGIWKATEVRINEERHDAAAAICPPSSLSFSLTGAAH